MSLVIPLFSPSVMAESMARLLFVVFVRFSLFSNLWRITSAPRCICCIVDMFSMFGFIPSALPFPAYAMKLMPCVLSLDFTLIPSPGFRFSAPFRLCERVSRTMVFCILPSVMMAL